MMASQDFGIIIAIAATGISMIGVIVAMMFWFRQEVNMLRSDAKEERKILLKISSDIESEMRDFHARLLEIERSKK